MTPDKKKIVHPLTPDYQIRKKKNNNNINNYQYNNYAPIKSTNPQNVIKYKTPNKIVKQNGKNYYLMPPAELPSKKEIIKSPAKIKAPIVEYTTEVIQLEPITMSKLKNFLIVVIIMFMLLKNVQKIFVLLLMKFGNCI